MNLIAVTFLTVSSLVVLLPAVNGWTVPIYHGSTYRFESKNYKDYYMRHKDYKMRIDKYEDSTIYKLDSQFKVVKSLLQVRNVDTVSLRSINYPQYYIRHAGYKCYIGRNDGSELFKADATWIPVLGLADEGQGVSFESLNFRGYYMRHSGYQLRIDKMIYSQLFRDDATWYPELVK